MKLLELEDMLLVGGIAMAGYGIYLVHAPSAHRGGSLPHRVGTQNGHGHGEALNPRLGMQNFPTFKMETVLASLYP